MKRTGVFSWIKITAVLLTAVFSLTVAGILAHGYSADTPPEQNPKSLISHYTKTAIVIDAKLNEKEWEYAESIKVDGALSVRPVKSENKMEVRTLWDEQNLYIAFNITDKNLQAKQTVQDHPQLSLDDIIEFLVDPRNDRDSCWQEDDEVYHINLLNQKKDDNGSAGCITNPKWNGNAKSSVRLSGTLNDSTDVDKGYTVEIALPWKDLNVKPRQGFKMAVDFANGDSGIYYDWTSARPLRTPVAFGNLILMK